MSKIITIARSYLGQKETANNSGFVDKSFLKKMQAVGWYKGAAWCLFFCRLVWKEAGIDISLIHPSAYKTWLEADKAGNWHTDPVEGAIAVFRMFKNGVATDKGHGCVVVEVGVGSYVTVDGNTTDKGGREGIMTAERIRSLNADSWTKKDGLRLMGFIHPKTAA